MYKINRAFIFLLVLAVGLVFITWLLLKQETTRFAQKNFEPVLLYPHLAARFDEVKIMQLEVGRGLSGVNKITLWRKPGETFFRNLQAGDFYAPLEKTNRLFYGLATLKAEAQRGARQAQLEKLGLIAPEKLGPAIRVSFYVFEPKNKKIASLLVGARPEQFDDVLGQFSIYVKPERLGGGTDPQATFLARGSLPLRTKLEDWLDLDFFGRWLNEPIDGAEFELKKAQFSLRGKKGWVLWRPNQQTDFVVSDRRGVPLPGIYDVKRMVKVSQNLKGLRFTAARPSAQVRFRRADTVIFQSFSGLAIIFEIVQNNSGIWAKITAKSTSQKAAPLAKKLRHHLKGFAFQLSNSQARRLLAQPKDLRKKRRVAPRTAPRRTR